MKALSLFSGGLDSQLAVAIIKDQGIEVIGLHFTTPFFGGSQDIKNAASALDMELLTIDISEDYIPKVLLNPVYGYGKNINPCIDCHAYMLNTAGSFFEKLSASFIITGEVVGQRPMSQNRSALNAVDKLSGLKGYILRPLSARLLDETIPEKKGWILREKLLDINGRGRSRQMELAAHWGLKDYPSPAGGCLLTETNFAKRLHQMLKFNCEPSAIEIQVLRLGRHIYIDDGTLLVIGRNQSENERLLQVALDSDLLLKATEKPGPTAILRAMKKELTDNNLEYAAAIVARYSDAKMDPKAKVKVFNKASQQLSRLEVAPISADQILETV